MSRKMKNATVTNIHNSARYRVLEIESKYYLIDLYRSWVGFILPFLSWFFPHNVIELKEEDALKLRTITEYKRSSAKKISILASAGIATTLSRPLTRLTQDLVLPIDNNIPLLIPAVGVAIFFRFVYFERKGKTLLDEISLKGRPTRKLLIFPTNVRGWVFIFVFPAFVMAAAIVFAMVTVKTGHIIIWLGFIVSLIGVLLMSSTTVTEGKSKVIFLDTKKQEKDRGVA